MIETNKIKVYLIMHPRTDGVFLTHFYSGECSWSFDILEAKKFFNGSAAKSCITQISKKNKQFPKLLEIVGGEYQIIDQEERVKKSLFDKELSKLNREKVRYEERKQQLENQLKEIKNRLDKLK